MAQQPTNFFSKTYSLIPSRWRKGLAGIMAAILCTSLVETVCMGVVALFISTVANPQILTSSARIHFFISQLPTRLFASPTDAMVTLGLAACALLILKNLLAVGTAYAYARLAAQLDAHFGSLLMRNYLNREYEWHAGRHSADLVTTGSWRQHVMRVWYFGMLVLNDITLVIMLGLALLFVAPVISVCTIAVLGGLALLILRVLRPRISGLARRYTAAEQNINRTSSTITQGIKEIIISSNQRSFFKRYQGEVTESARTYSAFLALSRVPSWVFETVGFCLLAGIIVASILYTQGTPSAGLSGQLALLGIVAWRALPAFNRIVSGLGTIREQMPKAEQVIDAITDAPAHFAPEAPERIRLRRELTLRDVRFRYRNAESDVLHSVSLTLRAGESVGLVGRSGSGKSTLADLVIGLLEPVAGAITVDNHVLSAANASGWFANVGYVGQSPFFTEASLLENVAFGIPSDQVDRDRVLRCCHMAALDDFLRQLPLGLDQSLGERATRLSGGQRQRVAIARALYRSPDLLILDEATSALDRQSENAIQGTVHSLAGSLAMLVIAHRLSTVQHCDRVVWLENGHIRMTGTPAEVLPHYRKFLEQEDPLPGTDTGEGDR